MTAVEERRPRTSPHGPARWLRKNLFATWLDSALTVLFGALAVYLVVRFVAFVFVNARWEIIEVNLKLLLVGRWPTAHLPRIAIAVSVLALWGGVIAGLISARQRRLGTSSIAGMTVVERLSDLFRRFGLTIATVLLLLALTDTAGPWIFALSAVAGGWLGRVLGGRVGRIRIPSWMAWLGALALVATPFVIYVYLADAVPLAEWEGFFFNITAAIAGIILCFPLGVLLALGRRSKLRLVQWMSITYIEFVRGSPLYVLLLLANVSLEFFVPASLAPSKVIRAIVTFTLFTAAYLAEIVRGGLQSIPRGQEEAAKSLGLSPFKQTSLIVLPQALRNVIPAQIGQFISLFKDTTLAGLALGIFDLLQGAQAITQQDAFRGQGLIIETLVFVGFLFWVGSFTMSRESQRLERKLGVGTR
jgi:general L-amino acid transport system permease protein